MRRKPSCARDVPAGVYNFSNFKMSQRKVEPVRVSQTRFPSRTASREEAGFDL